MSCEKLNPALHSLFTTMLAIGLSLPGATFAFPWNAQAGSMQLARDGQALVTIVVPATNVTAAEKTAADELATHLGKVTGGKYTVVAETEAAPAHKAIYVGQTRFAANRGIGFDKLGAEEYICRTTDDGNLILTGGRLRGTLYAVYHFLEDQLGCRWYTPWYEKIPTLPSCRVKPLNLKVAPRLMYRDQHTWLPDSRIYANQDQRKAYMSRNRWNGSVATGVAGVSPLIAGEYPHSFAYFIPADPYFKTHPEYFSMRDGVRVPAVNGVDGNQLCLTNPDLVRLMTTKVKEHLAATPDALAVNVSLNDGGKSTFCDCPVCIAKAAECGGQSGLLLSFINQLADGIKQDYPDKFVLTLAYNLTLSPPTTGIVPRDNVIVSACSGLNSGQVYLPKGTHSWEMLNLAQWASIARHVWGYDYLFVYPHRNSSMGALDPLFWKLEQQCKFIASHPSIDGMFQENPPFASPPVLAEFYEMRMWVLAKLMEDPGREMETLIADFVNGYYGAAGRPLLKYLALQHRGIQRWPWQMVNYAYIDKAQELFDQAEAAVKTTPELLARVKDLRLCLDITTLGFRSQIVRDYLDHGGILEKYPYKVSMVKQRLLNTLTATTNPYQLMQTPVEGLAPWTQIRAKTINYVNALCAGNEYAALPPELQSVPKDDLIEIPSPILLGEGGVTADLDAPLGLAHFRKRIPGDPYQDNELPFPVGLHDVTGQRSGDGTPKGTTGLITIAAKDIPGRGYHLYKSGRFSLTEWSYFYLSRSWQVQGDLATVYSPTKPNQEWELYASIKFSGPTYPHGVEGEPEGVWVDRIFLVRVAKHSAPNGSVDPQAKRTP